MKQKTYNFIISIISYLFLFVALMFFLFPVFWMFVTSIKQPQQAFAIPPVWLFKPTFENYTKTFLEGNYGQYMLTSLVVTTVSIMLATTISILAAYATSRFHFRGKATLLMSLLVFYTMPGIAYAIPLFMIYGRLNLLDTPVGLIIVFTALTIPFSTWVLHGYFISIPKELEDSAMVDGCTRLTALTRIILPLAAPGIAATAILTFIATWNAFLYPAILAGSKTKTLPVAVAAFITDTRIEWGQASAVASAVILPVLILILLGQRFIVMGLTSGAMKE